MTELLRLMFIGFLAFNIIITLLACMVIAIVIKHRQETTLPAHVSSFPRPVPTTQDILADLPTSPPLPVFPGGTPLLPCGHEQRSNARFCSVCGTPVPP